MSWGPFGPRAAECPKGVPRVSPECPDTFLTLSLIFFSLPFWKTARKTTQKGKDFFCCRTPKILGKEGKSAQNRKEFLEEEKGKEIQKGKERKIRAGDTLGTPFWALWGPGPEGPPRHSPGHSLGIPPQTRNSALNKELRLKVDVPQIL